MKPGILEIAAAGSATNAKSAPSSNMGYRERESAPRKALPRFRHFAPPGETSRLNHTTHPRAITDWIAEIRRAWSSGAHSTLALARVVSGAREALRQNAIWNRLWHNGLSKVPFSKRKAEMLARVGFELGNVDTQTFAHLPSGWTTLYYLAQLGRRTVERLIREERVHPDLTWKEAKTLLAELQPNRHRGARRSAMRDRLARFAGFIEAAAAEWAPEEQRFARREFARWVSLVPAAPEPPAADTSL
jgi:hypothetical protein